MLTFQCTREIREYAISVAMRPTVEGLRVLRACALTSKALRLFLLAGLLGPFLSTTATASLTSGQEGTLARLDSLWAANERDEFRRAIASELGRARTATDPEFTFHLLFKKGRTDAAVGLGADAEPVLREALALAERLDEPGHQCACLRWLGVALNYQGRRTEAAGVWTRLRTLAQEIGDVEHQAWAQTGLAFHDNLRGQAQSALEGYTRAVQLFETCGHPWGDLWALIGRGNALYALGRYTEALGNYEEADNKAHEKGWVWIEALAVNNVATTLYTLGDPGKARGGFQRACDLQLGAGNHAEAALAATNMSICDAELGRYEDAVADLERIRSECERHGIKQVEGSVRYEIANIRQREGRYHLAARLHRETLAMGESPTVVTRVETLIGLSRALTRIDSSKAALDLMRAEEVWSRAIDDPQLRLRYQTELGRLLVDSGNASVALPVLVDALKQAGSLEHSGYRLAAIATAARAAHSLALHDSALAILQQGVTLWEVERGQPADPEWREVRSASAKQIYSQLGSLLLEHPADDPPDDRARRAFDALQVFKARTLQERILGPEGGTTPRLPPSAVTCRRLQEEILAPGELLLDYYASDDECLLFAVSTEECRGVHLPQRAKLEEITHLYYETISTSPRRIPPERSTVADEEKRIVSEATLRMRDLLLGPVLDLVQRSRNLIVIPDGSFNLVSFRALLDADPREGGEERTAVLQRVPSATLFSQLRSPENRREAGPDASTRTPNAATGVLALQGEHGENGESLAGAKREVAGLKRRFRGVVTEIDIVLSPSDSVTARGSMAAAFLGSLDQFDILHFAAHSTADDQYPWRSRIHLHGFSAAPDGLDLFASEIANCKLSAQLAVLSTCRSAGARIVSGEGVQGLASALLSAGVPTVMATLWPVDDQTSARMIGLFYDGLARGRSPAEALTEAQSALRSSARTSHPFHWAGFILLGEGASRLDLRTKSRTARYLLPGLLVVLGICGILAPTLHRRWKSL